MIVYLDIVFLENVVINYIILYSTGILLKCQTKNKRLICGSVIGALYSVVFYLIDLKFYSSIFIKIILSIVIIYVSFNSKNFKVLLKQIVVFYLASFIFGGAILCLIYMLNTKNITIKNGVLIGNYTKKVIVIGLALAFITILLSINIIKTKIKKKDLICNIKVMVNNKKIETRAMIDTGNLLKEPITNIPVIVLEHTLFNKTIPKEILDNIDKILGGDMSNVPVNIQQEYMSKLRVIPFKSLGKENGLLLGIKAEKLKVEKEDEIKEIEKVVIGIYTKNISPKGEYRGLLGVNFT